MYADLLEKRKFLHKRKKFRSHGIGLGHQHGRHFTLLVHQYGRRDVMSKRSVEDFDKFHFGHNRK